MPPLLIPGYWSATYFPRGHWDPDYWPHFTLAVDGGSFGSWEPVPFKWTYPNDEDELLVLL